MPPRKPALYDGWFLNSFLCKAKDPHLVVQPCNPLETWDMTILSSSWNTSSLLHTLNPFYFRSADYLDSSTECTECHNWILIVQVVLFRYIILSHLQLTWTPSHQAVTWVVFLRWAFLIHPPTPGMDHNKLFWRSLSSAASSSTVPWMVTSTELRLPRSTASFLHLIYKLFILKPLFYRFLF